MYILQYTFYNVYRLSNYENLYYRYKDSYQNCSDTLEQEINKYNMYIRFTCTPESTI